MKLNLEKKQKRLEMFKFLILAAIAPFIGVGWMGWMFLPFYMIVSLIYLFLNARGLFSKYILLSIINVIVLAVINLTPFGVFYSILMIYANGLGLAIFAIAAPLIELERE